MTTYRIIRFYQVGSNLLLDEGLSLIEAQERCRDPESSSRTCTLPENKEHTEQHGPWFDGYTEE